MEKYVSFRIEKKDNNRVMAAINHDMRIGYQPKYIKSEKSNQNLLIQGQRMTNESHKNLIKEQNKRSSRKIQKNTERFSSGIMTFSSEMQKDYFENPDLFKDSSKNFLEVINEEFGLQITYAELHLDETTPHIHILFDNISPDGKSIRRNLHRKELSQIQTLMGKCFSPMGYQRGKDKNITRAEHLGVSDYQELKKEEEQLRNVINELKTVVNESKAEKADEKLNGIITQIESGEGKLNREDYEYLMKFMKFSNRFNSKQEKKVIDKIMMKGLEART